jgi:hypothetical protein
MYDRRDFLNSLIGAGVSPALASALGPMTSDVWRELQRGVVEPDPETIEFWNGFLASSAPPLAGVPTRLPRGSAASARDTFFFHHSAGTLRPAVDIPDSELIPEGDVSLSLNLASFKPSGGDRQSFERLKNAQLRLDAVQNVSMVDLFDTVAWTAVAVLWPDKRDKLPPIQNLSFDPTTSWQKMQNIVLPRGEGRWAMNVYGQRADGLFTRILQVLTKEVGRFSPVFSLPAVSTIALQSFNQFYGAFHNKPEYLFRSPLVPIYATASARKQGAISRGLPLRTGTYLLVPVEHASELSGSTLERLTLEQGFLVPKGTAAQDVPRVAEKVLPTVTYATIDVNVRAVKLPCK